MVDAIPALVTDKAVALYEKFGIYTRAELESRAEIQYETYAKVRNIEAKTMIDMAGKQIIPAVIKAVQGLADSMKSVSSICPEADVSVQKELLVQTSALLAETKRALEELKVQTEQALQVENVEEQARTYHDYVVPAMDALRKPVDELEMIVDKSMWPMPSYGDLLFEV